MGKIVLLHLKISSENDCFCHILFININNDNEIVIGNMGGVGVSITGKYRQQFPYVIKGSYLRIVAGGTVMKHQYHPVEYDL